MAVNTVTSLTAEELHARLKHVKVGGNACQYSLRKCAEFIPLINKINELKAEKNAVILAHSYVSPEITYGVADFVGDSYELSKNAKDTQADIIVFSAVRFMAETAKILNPEKDVLIPTLEDGCTLADSLNAETVRGLREKYPEHTFVCYINTTAEVKAECDVCVTSANAGRVIEAIENDKIYFLPDRLMGLNIRADLRRKKIKKDIEIYHGTCYVHEEYDPRMIDNIRLEYPGVKVVSHPECTPEVLEKSDYVGSTSQMISFVSQDESASYMMLTECGLAGRLQAVLPRKKFVGTCTMCRYMKSNNLENILRVLTNPTARDRIHVDEEVRLRALGSIQQMFRYS